MRWSLTQHWTWPQLAGYFGAGVLCIVSLIANLRYGLSLARDPLDKVAYGAASVAVDILKAALPLLALRLWHRRHHLMFVASAMLWVGCVSWSMSSAVGFSLATRAEANTERLTERATQSGWATTVSRAQGQLTALGIPRPAEVVKADLAAAQVPAHIWARTLKCTETTLHESQAACATVLGLRRELIAAQVAERLESTVAEGRAATSDIATIDPQAAALARLTGVHDGDVRTGLALLLAGIVELASAMGVTIVALATKSLPASVPNEAEKPLTIQPVRSTPTGAIQTRGTDIQVAANHLKVHRENRDNDLQAMVDSFLRDRTSRVEGRAIGATLLFEAFKTYSRTCGLVERSQQALGKELTRLGMPKVRCTLSGRFEYTGLVLKDQQRPFVRSSHPNLPDRSKPKVQAMAARNIRVKGAGQNALEGRLAPRAEPTNMLQPA